ncbi:hypothetical protein Sps_04702 [Shewanella psychrophila]|uniref:Uncharacterized protein n=1 Tax=Shewanella psychrophila TaxID=225848 RepID=A0A1S6HW47_9GAMM|nr:hypothetical protein Sps_04702 [Shewanella psychrophila]
MAATIKKYINIDGMIVTLLRKSIFKSDIDFPLAIMKTNIDNKSELPVKSNLNKIVIYPPKLHIILTLNSCKNAYTNMILVEK